MKTFSYFHEVLTALCLQFCYLCHRSDWGH